MCTMKEDSPTLAPDKEKVQEGTKANNDPRKVKAQRESGNQWKNLRVSAKTFFAKHKGIQPDATYQSTK